MRCKAMFLMRVGRELEKAKQMSGELRRMWFRPEEVEAMLEDLHRLQDLER